MLRAYDKTNGKEAGAVFMPAPQTGSPMTYMLNGKQYIVVAIGGGGSSGRVCGVQVGGQLPLFDTLLPHIGIQTVGRRRPLTRPA